MQIFYQEGFLRLAYPASLSRQNYKGYSYLLMLLSSLLWRGYVSEDMPSVQFSMDKIRDSNYQTLK